MKRSDADEAKGDEGFAGSDLTGEAIFSVVGISIFAGLGRSGFSVVFMKGLVFLSCSDVAKSRPLPDLKSLSSEGLACAFSASVNLGNDSLEGSGALGVKAGLSKVPPSLGNTGSLEEGEGLMAGIVASVDEDVCSGVLKGLKAEMEESNSKLSNSSDSLSLKLFSALKSNLEELAAWLMLDCFSIFSFVSLSLSAIDSVLSPGLNCTAKEESTKSSLPSGVFALLNKLKSSGSLGICLISFLINYLNFNEYEFSINTLMLRNRIISMGLITIFCLDFKVS